MSRPLFKLGVVQLETMFERSRADVRALTQLKDELRYREAGRAVALLKEVDAALKVLPRDDSQINKVELVSSRQVQQTIGARARPSTVQPDLLSSLELPPLARTTETTPNHVQSAEISATTKLSLTASDARDLLGVSQAASWLEVEEKRRKLVQAAFPGKLTAMNSDKRAVIEERADRANAAHTVLLAEKLSRGS